MSECIILQPIVIQADTTPRMIRLQEILQFPVKEISIISSNPVYVSFNGVIPEVTTYTSEAKRGSLYLPPNILLNLDGNPVSIGVITATGTANVTIIPIK